jgi:hypothetical protein
MFEQAGPHYATILQEIRDAGLTKHERVIESPQGAHIKVGGREVLNFCANNYLGLSSHPTVIEAARAALDERGYGLSSVRFICGTQDRHRDLELAIAKFIGTDDTVLYSSCFDANGGLFETLLGPEDAIISDALNHASIIDGIRLCKAQRHRYEHDDLDQLETALKDTQSSRLRMIATDGVFSMDGDIARLDAICDLAEKYGAMVMVDDSHATGFVGKTGRGTHEHRGVTSRVDIVTSTLGKFHRAARPPRDQHAALPRGHDEGRLRDPPGRAPDRPHHARRRASGRRLRGQAARRGHLRHRVRVPGGPARAGPHPRAAVGRALGRGRRPGHRRVHEGRHRARHRRRLSLLAVRAGPH